MSAFKTHQRLQLRVEGNTCSTPYVGVSCLHTPMIGGMLALSDRSICLGEERGMGTNIRFPKQDSIRHGRTRQADTPAQTPHCLRLSKKGGVEYGTSNNAHSETTYQSQDDLEDHLPVWAALHGSSWTDPSVRLRQCVSLLADECSWSL